VRETGVSIHPEVPAEYDPAGFDDAARGGSRARLSGSRTIASVPKPARPRLGHIHPLGTIRGSPTRRPARARVLLQLRSSLPALTARPQLVRSESYFGTGGTPASVVTAVAPRAFDARSANLWGGSLWDSDAAALEHAPVLCNEREKDERAKEEQRN
jgi:hypothetical protein